MSLAALSEFEPAFSEAGLGNIDFEAQHPELTRFYETRKDAIGLIPVDMIPFCLLASSINGSVDRLLQGFDSYLDKEVDSQFYLFHGLLKSHRTPEGDIVRSVLSPRHDPLHPTKRLVRNLVEVHWEGNRFLFGHRHFASSLLRFMSAENPSEIDGKLETGVNPFDEADHDYFAVVTHRIKR